MSRLSLAQQLKQLEEDAPRSIDPESAYASLDSHERPARDANEGREHYVDVGPSRLRAQADAEAAQTLLTDKYGGKSSSRNKIFDDDEDEEVEEEAQGGFDDEGDEDEDEDEDEEDEDEEDYSEEEEEGSDDEDDGEGDENDGDEAPSGRALDPVGALRASREKDIEKGRGIKRQKDLFDQLLAVRITFQKALAAGFKVPGEEPEDPAGEMADARVAALQSLAKLSDSLFDLRERITLPGTEGKKRKRDDDDADEEDFTEESYWKRAAKDSLALTDAAHPHMVPILAKWSTKIQAATLALGSRAAGGSKFMAATRGGVVEAIDASLAQRRDNLKPLLESEENAYRALLREVIESKQGTGNVDLSHLRREKKKKREAERGGSKGRKLRYTVHDKAVNFVVPIPLERAWHEEQVDELFASLFGGAGKAGAVSDLGGEKEAFTDLGGLKVF